MNSLERFDVVFTRTPADYHCGDIVEGNVTIKLAEKLSFTSIHISCQGRAYVGWSVSSGTYTKFVYKTEKKLNKEVIHGQIGLGDNMLRAGHHEIPFQFNLPPDLPCSYNGDTKCNIRYSVRATIHRKGNKDEHITEYFRLVPTLDLNSVPKSMNPVETETSAKIGTWCWMSGQLTVNLRVNKRGFVPGEDIIFDAVVQNECRKKIQRCVVGLYMMRTLRATHGYKDIFHDLLGYVEQKPTKAHEYSWKNATLRVPDVVPTLLSCDIIEIVYYIKLKILPHDISTDPIYVTIGTVPHAEPPKATNKGPNNNINANCNNSSIDSNPALAHLDTLDILKAFDTAKTNPLPNSKDKLPSINDTSKEIADNEMPKNGHSTTIPATRLTHDQVLMGKQQEKNDHHIQKSPYEQPDVVAKKNLFDRYSRELDTHEPDANCIPKIHHHRHMLRQMSQPASFNYCAELRSSHEYDYTPQHAHHHRHVLRQTSQPNHPTHQRYCNGICDSDGLTHRRKCVAL